MEIDKIPISEIIPYAKNPRNNSTSVDIVKKSIKEFGFRNPILLDKDNVIIAGHTRLKAAKELELKEVPVIWAENLSEAQVKALRIMDNKSGEKSEWNFTQLRQEFSELGDMGFNLEFTGFEDTEVTAIFAEEDPLSDKTGVNKLGNLVITCPKCLHKFKKKESRIEPY